ncbi:NAD(P)/FAD-dependent oxidoreductase [Novosphingobium malaysiense]|uniref:Pyridine nucleotide-disulfide oxidoreductase n=1 Tax=Novosphingobium malaysiense TaxID=1348853 RepID=A0A0B1ZHY6_9SPHN|nr:FAD-dependent oxidoreductase [Novosphingobium malaysiense]KHK88908.1 pyridine nucleotide-disulfide oxidoreductase [Novosphingobium malaysiense]
MSQKIVIAGTGFAGVWAALSATRAIALASKEEAVEVIVVSPTPNLVIRPRLYEAVLENMDPDVGALLAAVGARHLPGLVETIDVDRRTIKVARVSGGHETIAYDRFILATGSQLFHPAVPGLKEYAFNTDQLETARDLDAHLKALASKPETSARNTVVIAGGGLTGLEAATEMPIRLRAALGADAQFRVILIDTADQPGGSMGVAPQPYFAEALTHAGVEVRSAVRVDAIDAGSVTLSSGEQIETNTVVWAAGVRASPLTEQIAGERDAFGRIVGDAFLHAPAAEGIFVTGDAVRAATDDIGNVAAMSCQHALSLGRVAGHNAAAELVGLPLHPYSQPKYVTCVDLGDWGALFTEGWDRQVQLTRDEAKAVKQEINRVWIYPPAPDRDAVFAVANPDYVIVP